MLTITPPTWFSLAKKANKAELRILQYVLSEEIHCLHEEISRSKYVTGKPTNVFMYTLKNTIFADTCIYFYHTHFI
jgi:hypothetical protein